MWPFTATQTISISSDTSTQETSEFLDIDDAIDSPFRCVKCESPAIDEGVDEFTCESCGASFPVVLGVPLLVANFAISNSPYRLTDETASKICAQLGLAPSQEVYDRLRSILGNKYQVGDLAQSAENNYFLNRVVVDEAEKRPLAKALESGTPTNKDVRYSIDLHYVPKVLPANKQVSYNVRFTNCGDSIISSTAEKPVRLCYQFIGSDGEITEGHRTKLPIEVLPGRSLSVPLVIQTPSKPGKYELVIQFVHEDFAWLTKDGKRIAVDVTRKWLPKPWKSWKVTKIDHGGYGPDHVAGKEILINRIQKQKNPRVLEIGGCCNPMMRGVSSDLHSIDIDMQTLQIGHLLSEKLHQSVRYICADGSNLPYREHSFDWIVMFSTLHHFSDPAQVLEDLKRFLKPNGRIATMCEPLGHYFDGEIYDAFIEELEQGINEQTFTLEEYHMMIQNAGLKVDKAIIDVGSVKLILKA